MARGFNSYSAGEGAVALSQPAFLKLKEGIERDFQDLGNENSDRLKQYLKNSLLNIESDFKKVISGDTSPMESSKRVEEPWIPTRRMALYFAARDAGKLDKKAFQSQSDDELWAKYGKDKSAETLVWKDTDGKIMFKQTGSKDQVETFVYKGFFGNPDKKYKWAEGVEMWHNHPNEKGRVFGFPPSGGDIRTLLTNGAKMSVISAKEGTYIISPSKGHLETYKKLGDDWFDKNIKGKAVSWDSAFQKIAQGFGKSGWSNEERGIEMIKALNTFFSKNAESWGIDYKFIPRKGYENLL